MSNKISSQEFLEVLPKLRNEIARYNHLVSADTVPVIGVFGKFNHGKSTLLNALVGQEIFSASDKRETVKNKEYHDKSNNVIWLDTPGLDADLTGKDDDEAIKGAFVKADIVLFVHNIKTGELDSSEVSNFKNFLEKIKTKAILVLTQIDQVSSEFERNQAIEIIKKQFPMLDVISVSATRYQKGIAEDKEKLVELSGIPNLLSQISKLKNNVLEDRSKSINDIRNKISNEIRNEEDLVAKRIADISSKMEKARQVFLNDLDKYVQQVKQF